MQVFTHCIFLHLLHSTCNLCLFASCGVDNFHYAELDANASVIEVGMN